MASSTVRVAIDLDDVIRAGGLKQAILAWAQSSPDTASGTIGPEFSTSGPGPGWSKKHNASDFASLALDSDYGAMYYLDCEDGRLAQLVDDDEIEWTDDSVVCLLCPTVEEALDNPGEVAEMAQAVADTHGARSVKQEWRALIATIRDAAEALEDIDLDDLAD